MSSFKLKISTPNGDLFNGEAEKITLRGTEGELAILANHIPFITAVQPGDCAVHVDEDTVKFGYTEGGLLTVSKESVTLLAGDFKWTDSQD